MPVREVVTRSGKRFRGKFPSRKLGRMVGWESLYERDALKVVEYDPHVASYEEQPSEEVYYDDDGESRTYIPDIRIVWHDGRVTDVEVKPSSKLADRDLARKYELIKKRYAELGRLFEIWTEREIRDNQRFRNIERIHRARTGRSSPIQTQQLALNFGLPGVRLRRAIEIVGSEKALLQLLAVDQLRCDINAALNDAAFIWLADFKQGGA